VDTQNKTFSSIKGVLFNKDRTVLIIYPCGKQDRAYTIPASVASIDYRAFARNMNLTSVTLPASVTDIGNWAFFWCTGLTNISVDTQNKTFSSVQGVLFNKDRTVLVTYPCGKQDKAYTIPAGVTSIGNSSFYGCADLTSISIPAGVTSIETYAFYGCIGLSSVTLPAGFTSIGNNAFASCTGLTNITIPSSVTSIGDRAFYRCRSLASLTIPESVVSIGCYAFTETAWENRQPDGLVYAGKVLYTYKGTMPANTVINNIRADTIGIADSAFINCDDLIGITIPAGVTYIWFSAFYGCTGLTSVTIPSSVVSIEELAFEGCSNLRTVTVSRRTIIEEGAFSSGVQIVYSD